MRVKDVTPWLGRRRDSRSFCVPQHKPQSTLGSDIYALGSEYTPQCVKRRQGGSLRFFNMLSKITFTHNPVSDDPAGLAI